MDLSAVSPVGIQLLDYNAFKAFDPERLQKLRLAPCYLENLDILRAKSVFNDRSLMF
jgi:hypothetical protein